VKDMQNSRLQNIQNEILKYFQGKKFNPEFLDAAALDDLAIYKSLTINAFEEYLENIFPCTYLLIGGGTAHNRTSSRLRRTNDRSVPSVHEDHEDDENAEIEDCEQSRDRVSEIIRDYLERHLSVSAIYYESARAFPEFIKGDFFQDKYDPPNFIYELALVEWTEIELRNSPEKKLQQLKLNYPITKIRLLMKECPEEIDELKTADVDKEPEILEIRQAN
jgi:hypothetical protein